MNAVCLCALTLSLWPQSAKVSYEEALRTCIDIVAESDAQRADVFHTVAITTVESKFFPEAVSPAGALGPMQVMPKWWCPKKTAKGCDLVKAGVSAYKKVRKKYGLTLGLRWYAGCRGKCSRAIAYSRKVLERAKELKWRLRPFIDDFQDRRY